MAGDLTTVATETSLGAGPYSTLPRQLEPSVSPPTELPRSEGPDRVTPPSIQVGAPRRPLGTSLIAREPISPRKERLLKIGTATLYAGIPLFASGIPIAAGGAINDAFRFDSHVNSYTTPIGFSLSGAGFALILSGFIVVAAGSSGK